MIFESDEESGSGDMHHYIEKLKDKIGKVDIVFCLDSGCGNYE
jgi:acetylornithine deacetylase/succinyl-diaminopimelate desuccinylase-like protein